MKLNWESALLILLVLEILLFGAINPRMLDINMLLFSTSDFICIGIVALPLTLVIISGSEGIDLSVGAVITLSAVLIYRLTGGSDALTLPVLALALLCGAAVGALNGLGVTLLRIPPLVMTLGMTGVVHPGCVPLAVGLDAVSWIFTARNWLFRMSVMAAIPLRALLL